MLLYELISYCNQCLSGEIPSGKKHKWACQRFLYDVNRMEAGEENFPYTWSEEEAGKIVKWFSYLRHSKGILAKRPIFLTPWQKFVLCQIYGWRQKENGYKRFRQSFIEVGRKNAKSQMEAGVILYEMSTQSLKNSEIYECYTAGTKRDQSKIIYEECANLLRGSPLAAKFRITKDRIIHKKTGSFLKALCKEDGRKGDGTNPAVLVLDEYHQHPTTEFYDLGLGSDTKEPMLMIITTAGADLNCPCYQEEYKACSNMLNPDVDVCHEFYFVDILEADEGDDPAQLDTWKKANPIRAYYPEGIEKIKKAYELAKTMPEKMTAFLTKMLNIWVQQRDNSYMDMAKWKRCQVKEIPWNLKGLPVYVGFDMSSKIDLTSVAFVLPVRIGTDSYGKPVVKYVCFSHSFVPNREKLMERKFRDKAPYDTWEQLGFITVTDSEIVDQNVVMQYVFDICRKNQWEIQCLCFDPANAGKLMVDMSNEGYVVEEVFQSHKSLNESTAGYREQVYEGNVLYLFNPVLNFAMANAVVRQNNGLIKIDKDAVKQKIDPVDAILCAFKLALYHSFVELPDDDQWLDQSW